MPGAQVVLVPGEGLQPKRSAPSCPLSSQAQPWQCWEDKGRLDPESMRVTTIQLDPTSSGRRGRASLGGVSREAEIVAPQSWVGLLFHLDQGEGGRD